MSKKRVNDTKFKKTQRLFYILSIRDFIPSYGFLIRRFGVLQSTPPGKTDSKIVLKY